MSVMNVLSHRPLDRFLNSLLRLTTQKYLFRITGPLWGEPRVAGIVFPSQRTSNAESGELLHLEQLGHLHKMSTVWLSPRGKHKELGLEIWKHWHKMTKEIQYQNCLITAAELWLSCIQKVQGPVSISDKTSYCKISQSLEAARYLFRIVWSLSNVTGTSTTVLPICLSNFKAIRWFKLPISQFRDFTRSYVKTSYRILKQGAGYISKCVIAPVRGFWSWFGGVCSLTYCNGNFRVTMVSEPFNVIL